MAPTSHVPKSQTPMPYALSHAAEHRSSGRESIEPATGFSLLHTIQLGQSANAAASQTAKVAPTYSGCSAATGTAVMTALPPAVATPAAKKTPQTPHVVQHCEQNLRQELGTITRRVFDIIAGRRRVNDLRRINIDPIIHAAILTLSKNTSLKGVALQSFHASASADGKKVEFLGSCRVGPRVRAFTGTFRRGTAKTRPWTMTAFRVL